MHRSSSSVSPDRPVVPAGPVARLRQAWRRGLADSGLEQLNMRWRFRLVVFAFGLPFLAYIVWSASQQAVLQKDQVRERTLASAVLVATRFEAQIQQIDRLLATMAQALGGRVDDAAAVDRLFQGMRTYMPRSIDKLGLWSLDGENLATLDRPAGSRTVNVADRRYFRDVIAHRGLAIQGPFPSRSTNVEIIQFARPVFGPANELIAVITMSIRAGDLITHLDPDGKITGRALVTLLDDQGKIVLRSADAESWVGKPGADPTVSRAAFAKGSGTRENVDVDGRTRLAGYSVVSHRPWMVTVAEPIEQVTGPISESLLENLGIGLAILFMALLVAGRVASWTISPLLQLASDTTRLGDGDLSHRSEVATGGEIAKLAADFNRMASAVEERDAALEASRQQVQEIVGHFPGQVALIDREERYRFINRPSRRLLTSDPAAMIGKSLREVRGGVAYQAVAPSLHRALAGEANSVAFSLGEHAGGIHLLIQFVPVRDADGVVTGAYAFTHDVSEQKRAELLLAESRKRLLTITDNVPALICYVDDQGRFEFANSAFEEWLRRPLADIVGRTIDAVMVPAMAAHYGSLFARCMHGETVDGEIEVPSRGDGSRWLKGSFIPDFDEATGRVCGVYGLIREVTKEKLAEQSLTRLARFDSLTGLANRNQFNDILASVLVSEGREGHHVALMFLDIDHFKQINDRYGHACGDHLLKEFAQRLEGSVRPNDAVARLSGDEFVVLLQDLHSDEPQFIARKIIAAVEKVFVIEGRTLNVTASIGIATRAFVGEAPSAIMKRADEALYEAKGAGRNTFRLAR